MTRHRVRKGPRATGKAVIQKSTEYSCSSDRMAPKTREKSARADAIDLNPKQTIKSKLYINTLEDDSQNSKRCGHCGASVRSEDTETALQDPANAAAKVSAAPLDSIEPVDPRESPQEPSPAVLPEWNGRRRRAARSVRNFCQSRCGLPTEDVELQVADFLVTEDFRSRWASASDDESVAAATMVQMKKGSKQLVRSKSVSVGSPFIGTRDPNSSIQSNGFIRSVAENVANSL